MPTAEAALPGRDASMPGLADHLVLGTPLTPPFPEGTELAMFGMGCFWGAERLFWQAPRRLHHRGRVRGRIHSEPDVPGGLLGSDRPRRGRPRGVRPGSDELRGDAADLLGRSRPDAGHAPGERRRHAVPLGDLLDERRRSAKPRSSSRDRYQRELTRAGLGTITTEIAEAGPFYYAEPYHQQYLAANPNGYCGIGGTGVGLPGGQRRHGDDRLTLERSRVPATGAVNVMYGATNRNPSAA